MDNIELVVHPSEAELHRLQTNFPSPAAGVLAVALIVGIVAPAVAADDNTNKAPARSLFGDRCGVLEWPPGTPNLPGGYLFGFTDPTDPGNPCALDFASENDSRLGKRDGRYFALTSKNEVSYVAARNVALTLAIFGIYQRWSNVTAVQSVLANEGTGVFINRFNEVFIDGLSGEVFVRLLARAPGQPVAVTVALEPRWSRFDRVTGFRAEGYATEFKFLVDAVLTERLFAALNLNYGLGTQRFDIPGANWVRASATNVSAALAAQVYAAEKSWIEGIFLGAEVRYRSVFDGLLLNRMTGDALNVGPTFAVTFPGERIISIAWSPQVAGKARPASAPGALDLDNFERHEFRFKFAAPIYTPP